MFTRAHTHTLNNVNKRNTGANFVEPWEGKISWSKGFRPMNHTREHGCILGSWWIWLSRIHLSHGFYFYIPRSCPLFIIPHSHINCPIKINVFPLKQCTIEHAIICAVTLWNFKKFPHLPQDRLFNHLLQTGNKFWVPSNNLLPSNPFNRKEKKWGLLFSFWMTSNGNTSHPKKLL